MAQVRSKPLLHVWGLPLATTNQYTVPGGETALVKWLSAHNTHTAAVSFSIFLDFGAGSGRIYRHPSLAANEGVHIPLWWALPAGTILATASSVNGVIDLALFGAELEGVAD